MIANTLDLRTTKKVLINRNKIAEAINEAVVKTAGSIERGERLYAGEWSVIVLNLTLTLDKIDN